MIALWITAGVLVQGGGVTPDAPAVVGGGSGAKPRHWSERYGRYRLKREEKKEIAEEIAEAVQSASIAPLPSLSSWPALLSAPRSDQRDVLRFATKIADVDAPDMERFQAAMKIYQQQLFEARRLEAEADEEDVFLLM